MSVSDLGKNVNSNDPEIQQTASGNADLKRALMRHLSRMVKCFVGGDEMIVPMLDQSW